jgi:hypothetical protein
MIISIINGTITSEESDFIYSNENGAFWFEGYFFVGNTFYEGENACKYIDAELLGDDLSTPKNLNGVYQCVVLNNEKKKIFIFNDRFGFHQLFYFISKTVLFLGDNFWEVAQKAKAYDIDEVSLLEFLQYRFVTGKYTLAKDVFCTEPSSVYTIGYAHRDILMERKQYWRFRYNPTIESKAIAEEKIYDTLDKIVDKYKDAVFGNKKIGVNLTGGLDSRFILGLLVQKGIPRKNIRSFTFGSPTCGDLRIAREITSFLKIKSHEEVFDDSFTDFFDKGNIRDILRDIGFFTYYLQGYGFKKLNDKYRDIDYLLSGMDGFILSINASPQLFQITNFGQVADYIYRVNATILSKEECSTVTGYEPQSIKQKLFDRINENLDNTLDPVSAYYDWTYRNRNRKYLLSIYGFQSKSTVHLLQYYDYGFVDLMSKMPASFILGQIPYTNTMYKNVFIGQLEKLKEIPIEKRGVYYKMGNDYVEKEKPRITLKKIQDKLFNPPDSSFPYPIQKILRSSDGIFNRIFQELEKSGSKYLDTTKCIELMNKHRRSNRFTRYGLVAILSILTLEEMICNNKFQ